MSFDKEQDEFWDIDKLVPKKKHTVGTFATGITPTEHNIAGESREPRRENKIDFSLYGATQETESRSYVPEHSGLIKRVTVKRFLDKYDFYGSFRKAALVYYDYRTDKCDFAPFYSYMPQYSQLTAAQKNYYFYWRDLARRGKYIKSDYSYLYLYVYEILNLPDKIPPRDAIIILCRLWREYRGALPRIDAYFASWVQDFCLVYGLGCPMDEIGDFIFDILSVTQFKEFYLSDADFSSERGTDALIAYLSDYDFRQGKYSGGDSRELYSKYMHLSMQRLLFHLKEDGMMLGGGETAVTRREAFVHSLCTHAVKCKLEIEYVPLSHDARLRALVTGGVRYTENRLRALFGVKSRLLVKDFPDEYKRTVDRFFDGLIEDARRKSAKRDQPTYERLYDAPSEALSLTGADEIEMASWSTTARLVVDEDITDTDATPSTAGPVLESADTEPCKGADDYGLSAEDIKILKNIHGNAALMTDHTVAERINNAFYDTMGDVVLEETDGSYRVIEDYYEEVAEWLSKQTM